MALLRTTGREPRAAATGCPATATAGDTMTDSLPPAAPPSFPRRRESSETLVPQGHLITCRKRLFNRLDSRLRGNDEGGDGNDEEGVRHDGAGRRE